VRVSRIPRFYRARNTDPSLRSGHASNAQRLKQYPECVAEKAGKAVAIQADVSKPAEVRRLFDEAEKAVGGLDIVVANTGVLLSKPVVESTFWSLAQRNSRPMISIVGGDSWSL